MLDQLNEGDGGHVAIRLFLIAGQPLPNCRVARQHTLLFENESCKSRKGFGDGGDLERAVIDPTRRVQVAGSRRVSADLSASIAREVHNSSTKATGRRTYPSRVRNQTAASKRKAGCFPTQRSYFDSSPQELEAPSTPRRQRTRRSSFFLPINLFLDIFVQKK